MSTFPRALLAIVTMTFAIAACVTDDPEQAPCRDIPDGGCPLSFGVACDDPSCAAAYACNPDGTWSLDHTCPAHVSEDAGPSDDAAPVDAASFWGFDVSNIDAPPGSTGGDCAPPLQDGDCQVGVVLACGPNVDPCCGCQGLFVCQNGNWIPYGYCDDDAGLVIAPELKAPR